MNIFANKTVLICGALGVSGRAASWLCFEQGARVILSDAKEGTLPEDLDELRAAAEPGRILDVRPRQDAALLDEYEPDFVVTAPGLPPSVPVLVAARQRGVLVTGEIDAAYNVIQKVWETKPFVIAVTGTDGKSTTTGMIAHIAQAAFGVRAIPCGNFGLALSQIARKSDSADLLVVECSSFQLETVDTFHPQVAMILNVSEDHLDRYDGMREYLAAKMHILDKQARDDLFLAPAPVVLEARNYLGGGGSPRMEAVDNVPVSGPFHAGDVEVPSDALSLPGYHNRSNLSFALAALSDFAARTGHHLRPEELARAIRSFHGLPHRLERVCVAGNLEFVNDSKATTVQAVEAALAGFPGRRVYLLCGGKYKGGDFGRLVGPGREILAYGAAREILKEQMKLSRTFVDLEAAFSAVVTEARASSQPSVILLSPGCSSYDAYTSYTERGAHFRRLAAAVCAGEGS